VPAQKLRKSAGGREANSHRNLLHAKRHWLGARHGDRRQKRSTPQSGEVQALLVECALEGMAVDLEPVSDLA